MENNSMFNILLNCEENVENQCKECEETQNL